MCTMKDTLHWIFYMQSVVIHVMSNICYICICFRSSVKLSDSSLFKFKYWKLVYLSCCQISFSWIVHWFGKSPLQRKASNIFYIQQSWPLSMSHSLCNGKPIMKAIIDNPKHWNLLHSVLFWIFHYLFCTTKVRRDRD